MKTTAHIYNFVFSQNKRGTTKRGSDRVQHSKILKCMNVINSKIYNYLTEKVLS